MVRQLVPSLLVALEIARVRLKNRKARTRIGSPSLSIPRQQKTRNPPHRHVQEVVHETDEEEEEAEEAIDSSGPRCGGLFTIFK